MKKIYKLSKFFIKDYYQNLNIFYTRKNKLKINYKSIYTWLLTIIIIVLIFLSNKLITLFSGINEPGIFLKIYFLILTIIYTTQITFICSNIYFFSKDNEQILPLPLKPIEILIARFNTIISISYFMELLFLGIPLIMYGLIIAKSVLYFLYMIIVLIIFPIFPVIIISIFMLFFIQLIKIVKNREIFQIILVTSVSIILMISEFYIINTILSKDIIDIKITETNEIENATLNIDVLNQKLDQINQYFVFVNPSIKLLLQEQVLISILKLILINLVAFLLFINIGKILYNKVLIINYANKKIKKIKNIKYKKNKINRIYIKNEIKKINKNSIFLLYCVIKNILLIFVFAFLLKALLPEFINNINKNNIIEQIGEENFKLQISFLILGLMQILFTISNISITSISREGKNAIFMKYVPISLYKQFIYKGIPQIILNAFIVLIILVIIFSNIPQKLIFEFIYLFLICMLINIINSYLVLIVNLKKPNLDWITEIGAVKNDSNSLYQYVITICIILILIYFSKVLNGVNIIVSSIITFIVLIMSLIIILIYAKKNINKLFSKIE